MLELAARCYVPQNIYLADDTVAANIAFGIESEDIDFKAVERGSVIANLHDFVINELLVSTIQL